MRESDELILFTVFLKQLTQWNIAKKKKKVTILSKIDFEIFRSSVNQWNRLLLFLLDTRVLHRKNWEDERSLFQNSLHITRVLFMKIEFSHLRAISKLGRKFKTQLLAKHAAIFIPNSRDSHSNLAHLLHFLFPFRYLLFDRKGRRCTRVW